jgi:peptidoglycan/xylan/chitin deacetylase (PgdA/CDA1 family)
LSITFDDGFQHGANVAGDILRAYALPAAFYLVTGWIEPKRAAIRDVYNQNRSHGNWNFWRKMNAAGHEIGSHSFSHINASGRRARYMPWLLHHELKRSFDDLAREVPQRLYTVSMPWNAATARSYSVARSLYTACLVGSDRAAFNILSGFDPYRLVSWAPNTDTRPAEYARVLRSIPPGGWLVLQFHSFDEEGYQPLRRDTFSALCRIAADDPNIKVVTIGHMMESLQHEDLCD